jgi:SAM-dependent methyltransferase
MDASQYERFVNIDQKHWWFIARRKIVDCLLISKVDKTEGPLRILDIGTGSGGMIPLLSKYGHLTVTEPDNDTFQFTRARYIDAYPEVEFRHGGWESLDLAGKKFDLVTAFDVLEHCEYDRQALGSWKKWLKQNGTLLLTVPAFSWLWGTNDVLSHHYRRYTRGTLSSALSETAFTIDKMSYVNALMFVPVWISRNVKDRLEKIAAGDEAVEPWDFGMPPAPINATLEKMFSWETAILPKHDLPFGTSLVCVARSPGDG